MPLLKNHFRFTAASLALLSGTAIGCSGGAQQTNASSGTDEAGSVGAELQIPPGVSLASLNYSISGPGAFSKLGSIDLTNSSTISALISPVPAGTGYSLTLSGPTTDGSTTCLGSTSFSVIARETTPVAVHLECHEVPRNGSVLISGSLNICPVIDDLVPIPGDIYLGEGVRLAARAHDADHAPLPLAYHWSTDLGSLGDPSAPDPMFTCTTAGQAHITLSVSDGDPIASCADTRTTTVTCAPVIHKIKHLVVIYLENHSFDNLYGDFPGAEGRPNTPAFPQLDGPGGVPYVTLPQTDAHFPSTLPNQPFDITAFVPPDQKTVDLVHRFYQEQRQIDGGKMDLFTFVSDAKGLSMGYYPSAQLPIVALMNSIPNQATLCDHFFHAAFGGSFLNHHWLIAAASPMFPNAPASTIATLDANGNVIQDGFVTTDGFAINTAFTVNTPHPAATPPANLVPTQTNPTIGDRLSAAEVDWAWFSGGWNDAIAGRADPLFQFHHQPFAYYQNYADHTQGRADHLKDETEFLAEVAEGSLPAVSFVKPLGPDNEHPGYADLITGENHTVSLINALRNSALWNNSVVIITYDEHGGFWDHVAPPTVDRWGPGARVPTLVFSPFAKGGVDSTGYDTTAILKLIEKRWSLSPLGSRDAAQADLDVHALKL